MAEQMCLQLFRSVDGQMTNLTTALGAQGVAKRVKSYDGSVTNEFKEWIKSVEKFATLVTIPDERIKCVAYQASRSPVANIKATNHIE